MNVLLVNPPYLGRFSRQQRSPAVIRSGTLYYPYWLSFAAGVLKEAGFGVLLVDAVAEGMDFAGCLDRAAGFLPALAVVETSTPSIENDLSFCRELKARIPGLVLTLVGTHPSVCGEKILEVCPAVDAVAAGEYELTVLDIARRLSGKKTWDDVPGIVVRKGEGAVRTPARPFIENLDALPFVSRIYREYLPIEKYYFSLARHPMMMLITGRGCPNRCFFCVYPQTMHGTRYRFRSPENVVEELKFIRAELPQIREIVFEDDTFTADGARVTELCRRIREAGIRLRWFANVRADTPFEVLREMKRAGFSRCAVGFESGDPAMLEAMGKGITLEQSLAFKKNCDRLGILVHGCFMVGFPGETKESMEKTFELAERLRCDSAQFYPVFPYPGTKAHAWLAGQGCLTATDYSKWLDSLGNHACVYNLPGVSSGEMTAFCESAYRRYHFSPRYLSSKILQSILRPREALRNITAGLHFVRSQMRKGAS
jgi:radical SAM superfamily enzyme YgiQ (UPF0313 family)